MAKMKNEIQAGPPALIAKPSKSYEVEANYGEVETYLTGVQAKYKDLVWTQDNIDEVAVVKAELRGLRTSLEKVQKEVKSERFNEPKKRFDAKMDTLIAIIGSVESEIDTALNAKDQERIDELKEVLDSYKEHFQTVHSLRPEYLSKVVYEKAWFNKTAKESDSKKGLEAQFLVLKQSQVNFDADVKQIDKALAGYPEISRELITSRLEMGEAASVLIDWLDTEKARIDDVRANQPPRAEEKVSVGVQGGPAAKAVAGMSKAAANIDFSTDFPGKTKTVKVEITYPYDGADALNDLFNELKKFGVTVKKV